jgi:hypothetical protein
VEGLEVAPNLLVVQLALATQAKVLFLITIITENHIRQTDLHHSELASGCYGGDYCIASLLGQIPPTT